MKLNILLKFSKKSSGGKTTSNSLLLLQHFHLSFSKEWSLSPQREIRMKPYIEEKWVYKVTRMMEYYYHLCEDRLLTEQCENTQPSISITRPALLILHV
jgi:hypothetical protein